MHQTGRFHKLLIKYHLYYLHIFAELIAVMSLLGGKKINFHMLLRTSNSSTHYSVLVSQFIHVAMYLFVCRFVFLSIFASPMQPASGLSYE